KRFDLLQRVRRIIERHEEVFLAILAHHHGFKGVYVRAAGLVLLFHLDGIPAFFQAEFAVLLLARRGAGGDGEDAAIHAHVADLHLVWDAAEGDDGPVLKFKRRDDAQLLFSPFDHSSVTAVPASARSCCASAGEWPPPLYRAIPGWQISPRARHAKNASRNSATDGRAA